MDSVIKKLIPENTKGKTADVERSITLNSREEALDAFKRAYKRLLNVNLWHDLTGFASAEFLLKNEEGHESHRLARVGDYFQIDIPGPGPVSGDGYDWVQVEAIEDHANPDAGEESFGMRVRSCKNPNKPGNTTAHFFTSDATSTFIIYRKGNTVSASYHGRNEVLNTDTGILKDTIRNTMVGAGAIAGISELQWARLIESFLEAEV